MAEYDPSGLPDMDGDEAPSNQNGEYTYDAQADEGDEDDDYDPSSFNFGADNGDTSEQQDTAMQDEAQPIVVNPDTGATQDQTQPKQRTAAGFIIDESDEEEDNEQDAAAATTNAAPPPSQLNGTEGAHSGLGAVAVSEAAAQVQPVTLASEPTQDSAAAVQSAPAQADGVSLNGSTTTSTTSATLPATDHVSSDDAASSAVHAVPAPSLSAAAEADQGKQDIPPAAVDTTSVSATPVPSANGVTAPPGHSSNVPPTPTTQRLPHDKVGRLEDRIKEDPKADTQAWLELIAHYRDKDQLDNVRKVYERMLEVFPTMPSLWTARLSFEYDHFDRNRIDNLFSSSLPHVPNVDLWSMYLDYLRRVFPLTTDAQGQNRTIITNAFDVVLDNVGIDPDSGKIWREYVEFHKNGPGVIGGTGWQDQQKVDFVRKAYQKAIRVPSAELIKMWKEYDNFEMSLNKAQGRKTLQEQSPHYMTARTARNQLDEKIVGLDRRSLPILPPLEGHEGDDAFAAQVQKWRAWIEWEKADPLVLKDDDLPLYRKRILFVYQQAVTQLRFYPLMWFEAAQWCFEQVGGTEDMASKGEDFLDKGIAANPESVLLTLKKADRVEGTLDGGNTEEAAIANGDKLDPVYETCLKALYELFTKAEEQEKKAVAEVKERFAALPEEDPDQDVNGADDDDDEDSPTMPKPKTRQEEMEAQITAISTSSKAQLEVLRCTISYMWVAKMRVFRRIQGQGGPGRRKKGFRGVFAEARPRGQMNRDAYIASALMEWHCYKDPAALRIFERGKNLYAVDEVFALEYIKHLINLNDTTNARVVFETTITKILTDTKKLGPVIGTEELRRAKCRPLMEFMHQFESNYGDRAQIQKIEKRMAELYPLEPEVAKFTQRYALPTFDGVAVQLILSPTQVRPKTTMSMAVPSLEAPGMRGTPESSLRLGPNGPYVASPKRPFDDDDAETPQRKFMRAESPLKGAAGRRAQGGSTTTNNTTSAAVGTGGGGGGFMTKIYVPPSASGTGGSTAPPAGPPPLPRELNFLLQILPPAHTYRAVNFDPARVVGFLRTVDVESARPRAMATQAAGGFQAATVSGGYGGR